MIYFKYLRGASFGSIFRSEYKIESYYIDEPLDELASNGWTLGPHAGPPRWTVCCRTWTAYDCLTSMSGSALPVAYSRPHVRITAVTNVQTQANPTKIAACL